MTNELKPDDHLTIIRRHFDWATRTQMKGWQGRLDSLEDIPGKGLHAFVEWDSPTLLSLPSPYLERCERKDIEWHGALVPMRKVQPSESRDTPEKLDRAIRQTEDRIHRIAEFGEEGELSYQVIKDRSTIEAQEEAWLTFLQSELKFPFAAVVDYLDGWDEPDHYDGYPFLDADEDVKVFGLDGIDSGLGVTVLTRFRHREDVLPLIMLWPLGNSRGRKIIDAYRYWFETR